MTYWPYESNTCGYRRNEPGTNKRCCPPTTENRTGKDTEKNFRNSTRSDTKSVKQNNVNNGNTVFDLSEIPDGKALVGTDNTYIPIDEEGPCKEQEIHPFQMMQTAVTNAMFQAFIDDTGYITDAQRFGWSYVFYQQLEGNNSASPVGAEWWRKVDGACWNNISGLGSEDKHAADHPVVHVSWNDAKAFA